MQVLVYHTHNAMYTYMSIKHKITVFLLLFSWGFTYGQSPNSVLDSLDVYLTDIYTNFLKSYKTDDSSFSFVKSEITNGLKSPGSFDYEFKHLGRHMYAFNSPDNKLRVHNLLSCVGLNIINCSYITFIQQKTDSNSHTAYYLNDYVDIKDAYPYAVHNINKNGLNYYLFLLHTPLKNSLNEYKAMVLKPKGQQLVDATDEFFKKPKDYINVIFFFFPSIETKLEYNPETQEISYSGYYQKPDGSFEWGKPETAMVWKLVDGYFVKQNPTPEK